MSVDTQPPLGQLTRTPSAVAPAPATAGGGEQKPRRLEQKLLDVIKAVPAELPADKDGPQGHYRYASIDAVFKHLRQPLTDAGILVLPEGGMPHERQYATSGGNQRTASTVPARFTFVDVETGERLGPLEWLGGGQDDGEKGGTKGLTNAIRTFLIAFFQLSQSGTDGTGGAKGGRSGGGNPNKPATGPQKNLIERLARELNLSAKDFMNILRAARGMEYINVDGQTARNACAEHLGNLNGAEASKLIDTLNDRKATATA